MINNIYDRKNISHRELNFQEVHTKAYRGQFLDKKLKFEF